MWSHQLSLTLSKHFFSWGMKQLFEAESNLMAGAPLSFGNWGSEAQLVVENTLQMFYSVMHL